MKIKIKQAEQTAQAVLHKYGYNQREAKLISEVLIWAEISGSSQGLNKLFGWRVEKDKKADKPQIRNLSPTCLTVDGKRNNSTYICNLVLEKLISLAKKYGISIVGVNNINNSSGAIGFYTEKLARNGLVGIMMSSADPGVVPYGSNEPILGTNPISISIPTKSKPITLDMSTADLTWGDLVKASTEGKKLPSGVAFDHKGKPTTDPEKTKSGAVTGRYPVK